MKFWLFEKIKTEIALADEELSAWRCGVQHNGIQMVF